MNPVEKFHAEIQENIQHQSKDKKMIGICIKQNNEYKYSKPLLMNFSNKDFFAQ